ncbi:MAG: LLM class flavin-dependent oxidoreductase [Gammaproteobacteria bacterium]|nr:LLM class flavin-dependent oxidoreductase [Gammaproteobacteria bacterium]
MKLGLFLTPQWPQGADLSKVTDGLLEQARVARANGFSSVLVGQHMVTGPQLQMLQLVPLMARLLPAIEGMQIGAGVMLIPMLSPVLIAEEGATLDWMSHGHYILAGGLGYRPEAFEAMGTRKAHRAERMEEALEVIKRLWTEERVSYHGRHYHLSNVAPVQRGR